MSRRNMLKTVSLICGLVLLAAVALGVGKVIGYTGYRYDNASKYTAGNTELSGKVKNLDVDWTGGTVTIARHRENTVLVSDTSDKEISPDKELRWWLDGETLRIRYAKSGLLTTGLFPSPKKDLTITLPEELALDHVSIDATSARIDIPSLQADELSIDITSGSIEALADVRMASLEATSGEIFFETMNDADEISAEITSGLISLNTGYVKKVKADATSGDIRFAADGVDELKINVTSGNVVAALPQDFGFTAKLDTTSGRINYDLPLKKEGGAYVCGDGKASLSVDTTSGSITLTTAEAQKAAGQ